MATQLKREAAGREAPAKKTASPKTSPTKKTTSAKTSPAKKATPAKTSPAKKNADGKFPFWLGRLWCFFASLPPSLSSSLFMLMVYRCQDGSD